MSSRAFDVAVVGSGPAGAIAALELARAGARVVVLEKQEHPRDKTCGGGVVARAAKSIGLDLQGVTERSFRSAQMNLLGSGSTFSVSTKESEVLITMTMRSRLDYFLISAAQESGAEVLCNCKVTSLEFESDLVHLRANSKSVRARFVVGADGVHSVVAGLAGWPEHRHLAPAIEAELAVSKAQWDEFSRQVRFDFDVPPNGYGWVFPKREHLSVGVMSVLPRDRQLNADYQKYLQLLGLGSIRPKQRRGFLIPLAPRSRVLADRQVLLVGDAAGVADPVTAEGISNAVITGKLAARSIIEAKFERFEVERRYNDLVRKLVFPELFAGRILAKVLYGSPRIRAALFGKCGNMFVDVVADVIAGRRTYSGVLFSPKSFLRLARLLVYKR